MSENKKKLCLEGRERLRIEGVREVLSFDENGAVVQSEDGEVCVEGEGIRIVNLDRESAEIEITGRIDSIAYSRDAAQKRAGLMGRLFG